MRHVLQSNGTEYPSIAAANRATGIRGIWEVCNDRRKSAGGYGWRYLSDWEGGAWKVNARPKERVVVRSDGVRFRSLTAGARSVGVAIQNICAACAGRTKTVGGYGWRYFEDWPSGKAWEVVLQKSNRTAQNSTKTTPPMGF
jgi:hypothetical protein